MKEPYIEGVATHDDPESCADARKGGGEAFDRGTGGLGIEPRNQPVWGADVVISGGRQHEEERKREFFIGPTRSETPCTLGIFLHGNREILSPSGDDGALDRSRKAGGHNLEMHGEGKSDRLVGARLLCVSCSPDKHPRAASIPNPGRTTLALRARASQPARSTQLGENAEAVATRDTCAEDPASLALRPIRRPYPRQEPSALAAHARICAGGRPESVVTSRKGRPYRDRILERSTAVASLLFPRSVCVDGDLSTCGRTFASAPANASATSRKTQPHSPHTQLWRVLAAVVAVGVAAGSAPP